MILSIISSSFNKVDVVEVQQTESELVNEVQGLADPVQAPPPVQNIAPTPEGGQQNPDEE